MSMDLPSPIADYVEANARLDVDGMLTADPRVVTNPRLVPVLSFAEAAELAYFGAKVLHPATVLPAIEKNIPVRILNSRRPEVVGTMITAEGLRIELMESDVGTFFQSGASVPSSTGRETLERLAEELGKPMRQPHSMLLVQ